MALIVPQCHRFDTTGSKRRHSCLPVVQAAPDAAVDLLIDMQMLFNLAIKHHHICTLTAVIILNKVGIIIIMIINFLTTHIQLVLVELLLCPHLVLLAIVLEARLVHMIVVEVAPRLQRSIMKKQYVVVIIGQVVCLVICVRQDILIELVVLVLDVCDVCFSLCFLLTEQLSQLFSTVVVGQSVHLDVALAVGSVLLFCVLLCLVADFAQLLAWLLIILLWVLVWWCSAF